MSVHEEKQHGLWFHTLDVVFNVVVIIAIVAGIRTFLVSPFQVEGSSMTSTLEDNEYIIINKLAYFVGNPERGDIVVFHPPTEQKKYYVKRIIGIPGDEVMVKAGYVSVKKANDTTFTRLDEPYLDERNLGHTYNHPPASGDTSEMTYTVPEGKYFVLGDNRQGSLDSRSFQMIDGSMQPFVPENNIKGSVWFVALPFSKIQAFARPNYKLSQ